MYTRDLVTSVVGTVVKVALLAAVAFFIYRGATTCYNFGYRVFMEPAVATEEDAIDVEVTVTASMGAKEIGELFESKGLIKDGKLFIAQYYLSEFRAQVKPGTFILRTDMTAEEMMEAMTVTKETQDTEE